MTKKTPKGNSIAQSNPTAAAYDGLQLAFDHFNRTLFGGSLPHCLITMQRHARAYGYFSGGRFARAHGKSDGKQIDEIAMNPKHFAERTPEGILSTLAHEMAHSWQRHYGKEPSRCYHDRQFASKMKEIGLYPSSTAEPGGKETGPSMSHYVMAGGPFATACADFLKAHSTVFYQDIAIDIPRAKPKKKGGDDEGEEGGEDEAPKSKGRAKFVCLGCKLNAWAKPGANLRCGDCDRPLRPATEDEE